ncbi:GGDEF domain-containing protein [Pseudomonas aeruginosa]|nr:GGDEF domain-containing protein [Pseudomonas aeruginosa]
MAWGAALHQLGATLGILAVFFPLGLAFWACVRLALLCLALNLAVFLLFGGEENLRTNLLNTLYNGLVVLICSFALYLQDYAQREQFLGRRLLGMMAEQDSLTGLVNRRYYELLAQRALEQGAREEKGVALILVDVDDFKAYNDHYGHPAGDAALRQLGVVLRQGARRPLDIAARLGGEEFAVLLYDSEEGNTLAIAERLRQAVEALGIEHLGSSAGPCLTISLGVAYSTSGMGLDALYREADRALYEAKDAGRNAVRVAFRQHDRLE